MLTSWFDTYLQPKRRQHREMGAPIASGGVIHEQATVLVVEDDPTLLTTLAYNLLREGYRVLTAADGEAGLALARQELARLDLVVLDLMLPKLSGLQVLRHLRAETDIPILILSARGEEQDRIDGLELGADDYVVKPFALRELLARVRAGVRRRAVPAAQPPAVLFRGRLRIELERRRVLVGEEEVLLRPKEYGLLTTLAMEPGRVFDRQKLLDAVWGEDVIVDERTVDVHMSWLRGKLATAGLEGSSIQTVYGVGYRFVVSGDQAPATRNPPLPAAGLDGGSLQAAHAQWSTVRSETAGTRHLRKKGRNATMIHGWSGASLRREVLTLVLASAIGMNALPAHAQQTDLSALSGMIGADGSSTVGPLTQAVAEELNGQAPKVKISVDISGTGGGFKRFCDGETDISDASRPIKDEERAVCAKNGVDWYQFEVAYDGITVVTNKENTWVTCLTTDQLKQLWQKDNPANTWADLTPITQPTRSTSTDREPTPARSTPSSRPSSATPTFAKTSRRVRTIMCWSKAWPAMSMRSATSGLPTMRRTRIP